MFAGATVRRLATVLGAIGFVGLVVGLPLHMRSGEEGQKAHEARAFGEWASSVTGLPVT